MSKRLVFTPTNRLREIRKSRGLSLEDVAECLGTSPAQISRLETGKRGIHLKWFRKISAFYNILPSDLLLPQDGALTERERAIIDCLRAMPDYNRRMIEAAIFTEPSPPPA